MEGKEYRDNLAEKLHEIRNSDEEKPELARAKARGFLDAQQETAEYKDAKNEHAGDSIEEHAKDWFLECSKDKELTKELFTLIDKLNQIGITPVPIFSQYVYSIPGFNLGRIKYFMESVLRQLPMENSSTHYLDEGVKAIRNLVDRYCELFPIVMETNIDYDTLLKKHPFIRANIDKYIKEIYDAFGTGYGNPDWPVIINQSKFKSFCDGFKKSDETIAQEAKERNIFNIESEIKKLEKEVEEKKREIESKKKELEGLK